MASFDPNKYSGIVNIVGMQPRDIFLLFEVSKANLELITNAMDKCTLAIDSTNPDEIKQEQAFKELFQLFNSLLVDLDKNYGS